MYLPFQERDGNSQQPRSFLLDVVDTLVDNLVEVQYFIIFITLAQ